MKLGILIADLVVWDGTIWVTLQKGRYTAIERGVTPSGLDYAVYSNRTGQKAIYFCDIAALNAALEAATPPKVVDYNEANNVLLQELLNYFKGPRLQ